MKSSKRESSKKKKNKIKITKRQVKLIIILTIVFLAIIIVFIFCIQKKVTSIFNNFDKKTEESIVSKYEISYDENGNLIEVNTLTGETKITKADELETLSPRRMQVYESESKQKAEFLEMEKEQLNMLLDESEITEEEYYKRLSKAEIDALDIKEYLYVIDDYILMIDKGVYNSCNQGDFLRNMGELYNKYNAIVNVVDETVDDTTIPYIMFYVSGFSEKNFEDVKYGIAKALSNDNFLFEKNLQNISETQNVSETENIEDMQNEEETDDAKETIASTEALEENNKYGKDEVVENEE